MTPDSMLDSIETAFPDSSSARLAFRGALASAQQQLPPDLRLVGGPGTTPYGGVQRDDVVVRVNPGEPVAPLVGRVTSQAIWLRGGTWDAEASGPGFYATITPLNAAEAIAAPRARRILDARGRIPTNQIVLRRVVTRAMPPPAVVPPPAPASVAPPPIVAQPAPTPVPAEPYEPIIGGQPLVAPEPVPGEPFTLDEPFSLEEPFALEEVFSDVGSTDFTEFRRIPYTTEWIKSDTKQFEEWSTRDQAWLVSALGADTVAVFEALAFTKIDPADAAKFLVGVKCCIHYPADPADSNKLAPGSARFPVVLIVHGNHAALRRVSAPTASSVTVTLGSGGTIEVEEIPSHLGYEYLQQELARQGIVSMSVSTNPANALNSFIRMRAETVLAGLDILRRMNGQASSRFHNRLDFRKVGLLGHSRGGDAVVKAALLNLARPAATRFGIKAVCSLAPTDQTGTARTADRLTLEGADLFYLVVYGTHDGDVSGIGGGRAFSGTGFRHYDRATCAKSMVFLEGIAHNRFNTNWNNLPDYCDPDEPHVAQTPPPPVDPRIRTAADHQALAREYIGGLFRFRLNGDVSVRGLFDGSLVNSIGAQALIQWAFGARRLVIDDFEDEPTAGRDTLGGNVVAPPFATEVDFASAIVGTDPIDPHVQHQTKVLDAFARPGTWTTRAYRAEVPTARKDFRDFVVFTFRMTRWFDVSTLAAFSGTSFPSFKVRIRDGAGGVAEVDQTALDVTGLRAPARPYFHELFDANSGPSGEIINVTKVSLQTLVIPLSRFAGAALDNVQAVEFEFDLSLSGHVYVDSLMLIKP
jgi:hypothetical protein